MKMLLTEPRSLPRRQSRKKDHKKLKNKLDR